MNKHERNVGAACPGLINQETTTPKSALVASAERLADQLAQGDGRTEELILRNAQCRRVDQTEDIANITEEGIVLPPVVW